MSFGGIAESTRTLSYINNSANVVFNTPALSLALVTEGHAMFSESFNHGHCGVLPSASASATTSGARRSREELDNNTSKSGGSDNFFDGAASGDDDLDASDANPRARKKRYHRHTPQQIQELEALFTECPHPDEKQRLELSRRLSLKTRQVKFWFQNRRTQMKTQLERHDNSLLRQENDKLRAENMSLRDALRSPMCAGCGGPAIIGELSFEEQHFRIENARLKDELDRVCALAGKFLGSPISTLTPASAPVISMPSQPQTSGLELGLNGFVEPDFPSTTNIEGYCLERSVLLERGLAAMEELLKMAQGKEALWVKTTTSDDGVTREVLNREEYIRSAFTPCNINGLKLDGGGTSGGGATEASREMGVVIINSLALVETLMDSNRWAEMFPCMIGKTSTTEVICSGMGGTRNGALQLMRAELRVLSPLVPVREVSFLRFCKQHAEGVWAVVDVSVDSHTTVAGDDAPATYLNCKRLPSGCLVQDMPNGYSKVTWVEHAEYDENEMHPLYRDVIRAGMGFGAQRWVATLQRQCQCLAILMSSTLPFPDQTVATILPGGRRSMLKLAQRMTDNFCGGVCASREHKWSKLRAVGGSVAENVRVMTRKSVDDPGEPPGIVLSAATSVWLPVSPDRLFNFLRDERIRSHWDILSNGGPMQEMTHIAKGQDHGNCVSLLRATAVNPGQSSMLILQETSTDASGSLVVYAPVDVSAMHVVMNGGDSAYVALLPSGFAIIPDGPQEVGPDREREQSGGSLLTVAFQILVNSLPTAKLTVDSVQTVNNLISCTVQKIKAALPSEAA